MQYEHKTQYYETDQMGIIHHSNYIRWMEEARMDFMEKIGLPYSGMEEEQILSPVLSVACEYKSMTHFGETVVIATEIEKYNGIKLELSYTIRDKATQEVRCQGKSSHCFLNQAGHVISLKKEGEKYHQKFLEAASCS